MSTASDPDEDLIETEQHQSRSSRPPVRKVYLLALLAAVLAVGGFALTGPACNLKEPGRDLGDLNQREIVEQAINRFTDMGMTLAFTDTAHVLSRPTPVTASTPGVVINSVLAVKKRGDTSPVVTHHTGPNYVAYKLRLPDGACGYVFSTDAVQLTRH